MQIPAARIYFSGDDKKAITESIWDSLTTGQLTLGKNCREFEAKFSKYIGTNYAVSVNSGTSSIEIPYVFSM